MKPTFVLEARPSSELKSLLAAGWETGLRQGIVCYDPAEKQSFAAKPFRYHLLPQRALRPKNGQASLRLAQGVRHPHAPCPFDAEEFVRVRELAKVARGERSYSLVCNKYPVTPLHFLAVRSAGEPEETLPQYIQAAHEVEDIILLLLMLGDPYRCYFNSNRGADGSLSGSSVNHWHFQIFPRFEESPSSLPALPARIHDEEGGLRVGSVEGWPAQHVFVEGQVDELAAAARLLWRSIEALNRLDSAYNLEAQPQGGERFRAYLFPRRPASPIVVSGAGRVVVGELGPDMGGCELAGEIVIPSEAIFAWLREHPEEATAMTRRRLFETTRPPPP